MTTPRSKPRQQQKQQHKGGRKERNNAPVNRSRSNGSSSTASSSTNSSARGNSDQNNESPKNDDNMTPTRNLILDITSAADTTAFSSAVESVVLSPMNGLKSAVREVLLATEEALVGTIGESSSSSTTPSSPSSAAKSGFFFTGSAGSAAATSKNKLGSLKEECDADEDYDDDSNNLNDEKKTDDPDPHAHSPTVNIRHVHNGAAEVELMIDEDDEVDEDVDQDDSSSTLPPVVDFRRRRSSIMIQTEEHRSEPITMSLRVLRTKRLPFKSARVTIHVLDEHLGDLTDNNNDEERFETDVDGRPIVDKEVGCTFTAHCPSGDLVWGGPAASFTFSATTSSKLLFTVDNANPETNKSGSNSSLNDNGSATASRLWVKVFAADLLNGGYKQSPNCWLKLRDYGPTCLEKCGHIEVRLIKTPDATLHEQENCSIITPGPNLPRMQSYTIRKLSLYSVSPVTLNVYDVSNNQRIQQINNTTRRLGYGGIFHAAIEIHGREYSFGGTQNKKSDVSGIFASPPKRCPMHHYRESIYLGDSELSPEHVRIILEVLSPYWKARTYNLFRKNCAFFSRELAIQLGVGDIPEWVWSLASTAEKFEPTLLQINSYLSPKTSKPSPAKHHGSTATKSEEVKKAETVVAAVLRENDSDRKGLNAASSTQENLLDHAMAARIQRSFRATSSRTLNPKRSNRSLVKNC